MRGPINYTGSKYRLMSQILEHVPQGMEVLHDLFGGSACVSLNLMEYADSIVYNDRDKNLTKLMQYLHATSGVQVVHEVREVITKWGLGCGNKDEFHSFRDYFNKSPFTNTSAEFLALAYHSFSSSIRWNTAGTLITSSSGGDQAFFRKSHESRIIDVSNAFKGLPMSFESNDLFDIDFDKPKEFDLVYLDPPYLASGVSMYSHFWSEEQERYLLEMLDYLASRDVPFMLSNVLYSKGYHNEILVDWADQYKIIDLNITYKNSSHQVYEGKDLPTREVLITNIE